MNKLFYILNKITYGFVISLYLVIIISCSSLNNNEKKEVGNIINKTKNNYNQKGVNSLKKSDEKAEIHVIRGATLQQEGKYAEAALEFIEASKYDTSATIFFSLAKCYKELDKNDLAIDNLSIALEKNPKYVPALELLADLLMAKLEIEESVKIYEKIIELEPTRKHKFTLAILYEHYNIDKSISLFEKLYDEYYDQNVLNRLSNLYFQKNDKNNYIHTLERIYRNNPSNFKIAGQLIEFYIDEKQYSHSIEFLDTLDMNLTQSELSLCYELIMTKLIRDISAESVVMSKEIIKKIDGKFYFQWKVHLLGAYLSDKSGNKEKANEFISHTLKVADSSADITFQAGLFYFQKKDYNNSIMIFHKYRDLFPKDYRFPMYEGISYSLLENFKSALSCFQYSLSLDSSKSDNWIQLGLTHDRLGNPDSSDYYYEHALKIQPDNPLANNNYAYSLSERGLMLEKALKMSKTAIEQDSANSAFLDTYGWINYKLGNYVQALEYIQKAIASGEASAEVYEHLGDILIKLNENMKAIKAYQTAIEKEPNRQSILDKLKLLK